MVMHTIVYLDLQEASQALVKNTLLSPSACEWSERAILLLHQPGVSHLSASNATHVVLTRTYMQSTYNQGIIIALQHISANNVVCIHR